MKKACAKSLLLKLSIAGLCIASSPKSFAQCSNVLNSITYDTLAAGSGNDTHTFSMPKFNPMYGTLVATKINSIVSVNYGFVLKNVESVQRNFSVSVGRYDDFQSPVMPATYSNQMQVGIGTFPLNPGNSITQGLTNIIYRHLNSDSIVTNLADFMGAGNLSFAYNPITYTTLLGSSNYYYSASANDTVRFSVTYLYCNSFVLPITLKDFEAQKQNNNSVHLSWTGENSTTRSSYNIEKSTDGTRFNGVGEINDTAVAGMSKKYNFDYDATSENQDILYFRIKATDAYGRVTFSPVRTVDFNAVQSSGISLFPNPATRRITVRLNAGDSSPWDVAIYSASGQFIQRSTCTGDADVSIVFKELLSAGVYFIKATNSRANEYRVSHFVIN